jgi:hypothetical protein
MREVELCSAAALVVLECEVVGVTCFERHHRTASSRRVLGPVVDQALTVD